MNQGLLFGEPEEQRKSDAEIEWQLRRLKQAWVGTLDAAKLEEINGRIRIVTRPLDRHPDWWSVPTCECRECLAYEDYLGKEGLK